MAEALGTTTKELELALEDPAPRSRWERSRRGSLRTARALLRWTPVAVPLFLLVQLGLYGLHPAVAEAHRLDEAEAVVHARVRALQAERLELDEDAERLADPVYRARVTRSLLVPGREPLTLERAHEEVEEAARREAAARADAQADPGRP